MYGQKMTIKQRGIRIGLTLLFLFSAFLNVFTTRPQPLQSRPFEEATITADKVNLRLRPDTESPKVLELAKGTRVGVFTEEGDGWYRIIYGNYRGYVNKDYVFLPSTDFIIGHVLTDGLQVKTEPPATFQLAVGSLNAGVPRHHQKHMRRMVRDRSRRRYCGFRAPKRR